MTFGTAALLVLAGLGAGLIGNVAGLASLVSYPALLVAGLGPVAANVTNTVALVGSGIGGIHGSRPELMGQRARVRGLAVPAVGGGAAGGVLLLITPAGGFEKVVPWLIALGSVAVLLRPRPSPVRLAGGADLGPDARDRWLWWGVLLISVYGGYFGAAAGVLLVALLLLLTGESVARSSAARTILLFLANGVAALYFAIFGPVDWLAALWMGSGVVAGSRLGPMILRRAPERPIRILIAVAGMGLAIRLGLEAYL
jgi:hypothetical protein